jgi:hypothetical protein
LLALGADEDVGQLAIGRAQASMTASVAISAPSTSRMARSRQSPTIG